MQLIRALVHSFKLDSVKLSFKLAEWPASPSACLALELMRAACSLHPLLDTHYFNSCTLHLCGTAASNTSGKRVGGNQNSAVVVPFAR